jgi:tetratricopeptide (TPR) repeat protein
MRRWLAAAVLGVAVSLCAAQTGDVNKANDLYKAGKRLEALPLYEQLAKEHPGEWLYAERLADCLGVKALQITDPAEYKAIRTRMRDEAKRAVDLGDTAAYIHMIAEVDPAEPLFHGMVSPGKSLLAEAEKAYGVGDFKTAMEKYTAAAVADPTLYEAALFAGDTAYVQKDLKTAGHWFQRAIEIDPNRETAYRYWGDAILKYGSDPQAAKEKFIDAVVAEPYNRLAWQGIQQWAEIEKAVILAPKIERPAGPEVDAKNPKNITIHIDPGATDDKQNPGSSSWVIYSMSRANFRGDEFKKNFPQEKEYRHTLMEEDRALTLVLTMLKERKISADKMDESLRTLLDLNNAGMLDCWILLSAPDQGIAQDYGVYRNDHRPLLHEYLARYVVHGGPAR